MKWPNYKGVMTPAPEQLPVKILASHDQHITLTKDDKAYRVTYGLQTEDYTDWHDALTQFNECVIHARLGK